MASGHKYQEIQDISGSNTVLLVTLQMCESATSKINDLLTEVDNVLAKINGQ